MLKFQADIEDNSKEACSSHYLRGTDKLISRHPVSQNERGFLFLLLLTKMLTKVAIKEELYDQFWPGEMNYDGNNKPYARQISDHKRKIIAQIENGIAGDKDKVLTATLINACKAKLPY